MSAPLLDPSLRPESAAERSSGAQSGNEASVPAPPIPTSLQDPAAYRAFVKSLYAGLEERLASPLDDDVAAELASLTRLLNVMPPQAVEQNAVLFQLAFKILQGPQPNVLLLKSVRRDLWAIADRYAGGFSKVLTLASGKSLLNALLSALFTIVVMSFVFVLVMGGGVKVMLAVASGAIPDARLTEFLKGPSFDELLFMTHAAFLGSVVSIMARVKTFVSAASMTPLMTYVSVVTRPVLSVMVAALVFCALKSGTVSLHGIDLDGPNGYYMAWGLGFLCGFSERLGQNFVVAAGSVLGVPGSKTTGDREVPAERL